MVFTLYTLKNASSLKFTVIQLVYTLEKGTVKIIAETSGLLSLRTAALISVRNSMND